MKQDLRKFNIAFRFEQYMDQVKLSHIEKDSTQYKVMKNCFYSAFGSALVLIIEAADIPNPIQSIQLVESIQRQVQLHFELEISKEG